ncbi:hypothetical protein GCM10023168_23450 [Fodinibacter luteus]|uniref:Histidine kinase domain-containing protein n=1 Tax=Fodinibacter luteus TaxID=552064 RepID=A0ABP8KIN0_9MICO
MVEVVAVGLAMSLCSAALALLVRRPTHPVSLVIAVMAASSVLGVSQPDGRVTDALWALSHLPLSMLLVVFPDGPRGRRWARVLGYQVVALGCVVGGSVLWPDGSAPPVARVVLWVLAVSFVPIAAAAVVSLVRLWRVSVGGRRSRIGLVLAAGTFLLVPNVFLAPPVLALESMGVSTEPFSAVAGSTSGLAFAAVPLAVAVAALAEPGGRRLRVVEWVWRVGLVAAGGLVLGGTVALTIEAWSGGMPFPPGAAAAAFVVVALGTAAGVSLSHRAAGWVPLAGERTRLGVADLADRLSSAPTADEVPALVARTVGEALELRGAAVVMSLHGGEERLATWGDLDGGAAPVTRPLTHAGTIVGRIVLAPHRDGVPLDLAALDALATPVAATVAAGLLTRELQQARDRVLQIRDDERARLRDDLHDELSPSLAGLRLTATAARDRLADDDLAGADALLARIDTEAARTAKVVRGILEGLHPDDLARGGLLDALRDRAAALDRSAAFTITVEAPTQLPAVAPQTEAAVFRTAVEAMANAARHANGSRCTVRLSADSQHLHLDVADDGTGLPSPPRPGLGLPSMAARTEAVGGELQLVTADAGGTIVRARFPLPASTQAAR